MSKIQSLLIAQLIFFLAFVIIMLTAVESESSPLAQSTATDWEWVDECIDCPIYFNDLDGRSAQLDSAGQPHVAFGSNGVFYATFDGAVWNMVTVDDEIVEAENVQLQLDSADNPHILYNDYFNGTLNYAYFDGSTWHLEIFGGLGRAYLLIDSADTVHIIAYDRFMDKTIHVRLQVDQWETEIIADGNILNGDIALDTNDVIHILHTGPDALHTFQNEDGWESEPLDDELNDLLDGSLMEYITIDHEGYFHILGDHFDYYRQDTTGWEAINVTSVTTNTYKPHSIATSDDGTVFISFTTISYNNDPICALPSVSHLLRMAIREVDGSWTREYRVGGGGSVVMPSANAERYHWLYVNNTHLRHDTLLLPFQEVTSRRRIDELNDARTQDNQIHLFYTSNRGRIYPHNYASRGSAWQIEEVWDGELGTCWFGYGFSDWSLAADNTKFLHRDVSSYLGSYNVLYQGDENGWFGQLTPRDNFFLPVMGNDQQGIVHRFTMPATNSIQHEKYENGMWSQSPLSQGELLQYAFSPESVPFLFYEQEIEGQRWLYSAELSAGEWITHPIDRLDSYTTIVKANADYPDRRTVFYERDSEIYSAIWDGQMWEIVPVGISHLGLYSLLYDTGSETYITHHQYTNYTLFWRDSANIWQSRVLNDDVARNGTIQINSSGDVFLTYQVAGTLFIEYGSASTGWQMHTIEDNVSDYVVEIDEIDRLHVAYKENDHTLNYVLYDGTWQTPIEAQPIDELEAVLIQDELPYIIYSDNKGLKGLYPIPPDPIYYQLLPVVFSEN